MLTKKGGQGVNTVTSQAALQQDLSGREKKRSGAQAAGGQSSGRVLRWAQAAGGAVERVCWAQAFTARQQARYGAKLAEKRLSAPFRRRSGGVEGGVDIGMRNERLYAPRSFSVYLRCRVQDQGRRRLPGAFGTAQALVKDQGGTHSNGAFLVSNGKDWISIPTERLREKAALWPLSYATRPCRWRVAGKARRQ